MESTWTEPALPVQERRSGNVPVRIIRPDRCDAVYVHLHAGGRILGSARMADAQNARTATECGVAVVSVDYRLAPEAP